MAFKLMMSAQKKWRKLDGQNRLPEIIQGVEFRDGLRHVQVAAFRNGAVSVKCSKIAGLQHDTAWPFAKRRCWSRGDIMHRSGASAIPTSRFQVVAVEPRLGLRG
jgi:hypothetical protein